MTWIGDCVAAFPLGAFILGGVLFFGGMTIGAGVELLLVERAIRAGRL